MSFKVLETLNWPGGGLTPDSRKVTGDDRFGFDEAAGTAWVLDGATDLGPYRLFDREESDAAWIAEEVNRQLIIRNPANFPDIKSFFNEVLTAVRETARKKSRVKLENADASTLPIASGMWLWAHGETVTFVRLGDCIALIAPPEGPVEILEHRVSADLETDTSKKLNAMTPEDKLQGLRQIRATQNTEPQYAIFGLSPHAVNNLVIETRALPAGSHILLMSDGLWRLVDVYKLMSAEALMEQAITNGIEPLAKQLRTFEKGDEQDTSVRIKASDDASAVFIQL